MSLSPSPYLEAAGRRWSDQSALAQRDFELALEALYGRARQLREFYGIAGRHRREDLAQLQAAQKETLQRWDERFDRLRGWSTSAETSRITVERLARWESTARWFEKVRRLAGRRGPGLQARVGAFESRLAAFAQQLRDWSDRLAFKAAEVRRQSSMDVVQDGATLVEPARKRQLLDFVFAEQSQEEELTTELRSLRREFDLFLARLGDLGQALSAKADINPGHFELAKNQILDEWRPLERRVRALQETAAQAVASVEESHQLLRSLYAKAQSMRAVRTEETPHWTQRLRELAASLFFGRG